MKKKILLFAALMLSTLFSDQAAAQTAIERLKTEYPVVMEQYGKRLESLKADYIIAIDVSGTMNQYKETVVPALQEFLGSIPDGDYVSIIKFGTVAKEAGLSGQINQGNRASFQQTLGQIYDRDNDCFYQTNICKMLEFAYERMNRPGHNDLQYVFMFTDFVEDANTSKAEWDAISAKMKASSSRNIVLPFAMQLNGPGAGRDIPKVRNVLPSLRIISINNANELNSWFEEQKTDISVSRLRDLIVGDFNQWYAEDKIAAALAIGIDKGMRLSYMVDDVVPAFVNGFRIDTCEVVKQSNCIEKIYLAIDSVYKGRSIKTKVEFIKFFNKALVQNDVSTTLKLTFTPTFTTGDKEGEPSFANDIRNLGLENNLMHTTELTAEENFVLGWNIWLVCAMIIFLLVFLYFFVKMTVLPYKLKNIMIVVTSTSTNQRFSHVFNNEMIVLSGKKGVILPQADYVLAVHGSRGFPIFLPRGIVFEIVEKPQNSKLFLYKNNQVVPSMKTKVKADESVKIQQGSITYTYVLKSR